MNNDLGWWIVAWVAMASVILIVTLSYHSVQKDFIKHGYIQEQKLGTTEIVWVKP